MKNLKLRGTIFLKYYFEYKQKEEIVAQKIITF